MTGASEWRRVDAALDEILSLPSGKWQEACQRIAGDDTALLRELESLLANIEGDDPVLDHPAAGRATGSRITGALPVGTQSHPAGPAGPAGLAAGTRIGAFRVIQLLGRGGMGEVYRAERADGHFEQQVAIKLMRPEVADRAQRFHAERQILARLEHPNIAGLHDGGVAGDGRLFMVMDLIEGQPITQWCAAQHCTLTRRLQLFLSVCDAVAYAHRKLVVHRDLKPGNVFVTHDGEVKLLDFGIARLLDQAPRDETRQAAMTPGYAAPEQLTGGQITTATDVYALGILLFELLTGSNPWGSDELPLAVLVGRVLDENVPMPSKFAARHDQPPIPAKFLNGDLDAIVAKAMRREPESRYESVAQLQADVIRTLRAEPVSAREGARWYVVGRFLQRHRWGAAAAAVLMLAILGAAGGIAWQGHIAKQEAARALAVKNFLVQVFRASDPRIASDKPRGQITAKELLDGSVGRIEHDFAGQPELQLELLGIASEIYGYLLDDSRFEALMKQRAALARRLYGEHHPIYINGEITEAWASLYIMDFADANRRLQRADTLLREAKLDDSALRAEWWTAYERVLHVAPNSDPLRRHALDEAMRLFARYDPLSTSYPAAIANAATMRGLNAEFPEAESLNRLAIRVEEGLPDRDDGDLALIYGNLGDTLTKLGRFADAEKVYDKAVDLARRTFGEHYGTFWRTLGSHAQLLFFHGDRDRALAMFARLFAAIPADWKETTDPTAVREIYADCLTRDGRAGEAVPLLEEAVKVQAARPSHDFDLRRAKFLLGVAYRDVGRIDQARDALEWSLRDYESHEQGDRPVVLEAREQWGRLLLDHPRGADDVLAGRAALGKVIATSGRTAPYTTAVAEAHADLARDSLRIGKAADAVQELTAAEYALRRVKSEYDVRVGDDLLLLKTEILAALGRVPEARDAAGQALRAVQSHDSPQSAQASRAHVLMARLDRPAAT